MIVFDPAVTQRLLDVLGDGARPLVVELIDAFGEQGPGLVEAMRAGVAAGDASVVRLSAHSLKSNAATLGAPELEASCRELEGLARRGLLDGAATVLARIEAAYPPAVEAFETLARAWGRPASEASG